MLYYLLYYADGFLRKFPLKKKQLSIGRNPDNDLVIAKSFVSRRHVRLYVEDGIWQLKDLGSKNGTYVAGEKVDRAVLQVGDSFCLKHMEFILKQGEAGDFKAAEKVVAVFRQRMDGEEAHGNTRTHTVSEPEQDMFYTILDMAMRADSYSQFLMKLSASFSRMFHAGNLLLVCANQYTVPLLVEDKEAIKQTRALVCQGVLKDVPCLQRLNIAPGAACWLCPCSLRKGQGVLVFFPSQAAETVDFSAADFITTLAQFISLAAHINPMEKECPALPAETGDSPIITRNKQMKQAIKRAIRLAQSDLFILIQGESGTGKELLARLVHHHSKRRDRDLIAVNCAAIPNTLVEAELFGHEKGAFTGAVDRRIGKLEQASGGTLVLDHIGDMPLALQAKLLRALQEKVIYRVGGTAPIQVDLRVVSSTSRDISRMMRTGVFRADLYFRLVHHTIHLLPLRKRREDILPLFNHYLDVYGEMYKKCPKGLSLEAIGLLQQYDWPGNVLELMHEAASLVNMVADGEVIGSDLLSPLIRQHAETGPSKGKGKNKASLQEQRKALIALLEKNNWHKTRTARELEMTYMGLHKKMKRLGIKKPGA